MIQEKKIIIAIDGPAASGKGTLARKLSKKLGYEYMDTGALYRLVAKSVIDNNIDINNTDDIINTAQKIKESFETSQLENPDLKTDEIGIITSKISAIPEVRKELIEIQSNFANKKQGNGAILDGRDIGTVICPHADIKLFITATLETRAQRRTDELQSKNINTSYETVFREMKERDERDKNRKTAPAKPSNDAYIINTSSLSPDKLLETVFSIIGKKISKLNK